MDYAEKLKRLRDRRQGFYTKDGLFLAQKAQLEGREDERFASLLVPAPVKYALGAMQAVAGSYTEKCYEEGERVAARLHEGMTNMGIPTSHDFQGSVPLDVHVRGNSDVDLLLLHGGFVTVEQQVLDRYTKYGGASPVEELRLLRANAIAILERRYYGATVNSTGSKSITVSGGSLQRVVDVVPSHWHDTHLWVVTKDKKHREIYILDSKKGVRIHNRPFMHMHQIMQRCAMFGGALRKIIRLLKNLRYDSTPQIQLSSYDIAALAWNMPGDTLLVRPGYDLLLCWRALQHLERVTSDSTYRDSLIVPDGSRKLFDESAKVAAVRRLFSELDALATAVASALRPMNVWDPGYRRAALSETRIDL